MSGSGYRRMTGKPKVERMLASLSVLKLSSRNLGSKFFMVGFVTSSEAL